jgi:hypothetical protein
MRDLQLLRLAVHYVDRKANKFLLAPSEQDVNSLDNTILDFFVKLIKNVADEEDTGPHRSASFMPDNDTLADPVTIRHQIESILENEKTFFDVSKNLANRLYQRTPGTASSGLLATIKYRRLVDGRNFVSIPKIRHKDQQFVRLLETALTQLEVEQVQNMLLDSIQKGAVIPHPYRDDYDIKVVDKQAPDDPAQYFTTNFIGCKAKRSDEHQIKELIPELFRYSRKKNAVLNIERIPYVIKALQNEKDNIDTETLAKIVDKQKLFDDKFRRNEFVTFINTQSTLGLIDIPVSRFIGKGKTGDKARNLVYKFEGPRYGGLTITGSSEMFETIVETKGDKVIIHLETTKDGIDIKYE